MIARESCRSVVTCAAHAVKLLLRPGKSSASVGHASCVVPRASLARRQRQRATMGKIAAGASLQDVKVKVPRSSGSGRCGAELVGFLACLDASGGNESDCRAARERLAACMAADRGPKPSRHKLPINYHFQRVCPRPLPAAHKTLLTPCNTPQNLRGPSLAVLEERQKVTPPPRNHPGVHAGPLPQLTADILSRAPGPRANAQ